MKKKLLVFLQQSYYQKKLDLVLEKFSDYEITVISRSKLVISSNILVNHSTTSLLQMIKFIIKLRKVKFDVLLTSSVDDFFFHLMFKFISFKDLNTFDEGQRSLIPDDFYFRREFADKGQSKRKLLNSLFKFPLPYGRYFDESSTHFTFYDKKHFNHALKDHKNLILLEGKRNKKSIKRIFVGVSSLWWSDFQGGIIEKGGNFYNQRLTQAAKRVNEINPDLYLMHPREDSELARLLNNHIIISKGPYGGSEYFINALNNSNKVEVYTERSGLVFDLDLDVDVVFLDIFDRFDKGSFQGFIDKFDNLRKLRDKNTKPSKRISY